jgi:hypothetical protein
MNSPAHLLVQMWSAVAPEAWGQAQDLMAVTHQADPNRAPPLVMTPVSEVERTR